jgi:hypothetical protein
MNVNHLWTSLAGLSPLIPPASFRSNPSGSKSMYPCTTVLNLYEQFGHRWAQANIRKGQAGVSPKDVYGSRV